MTSGQKYRCQQLIETFIKRTALSENVYDLHSTAFEIFICTAFHILLIPYLLAYSQVWSMRLFQYFTSEWKTTILNKLIFLPDEQSWPLWQLLSCFVQTSAVFCQKLVNGSLPSRNFHLPPYFCILQTFPKSILIS